MGEIFKFHEDIKTTFIINVERLNCPLPFFRTKKYVSKLSVGDILQIDGVQKKLRADIQEWCERNGHIFLGEKELLGYTSFFIKKG